MRAAQNTILSAGLASLAAAHGVHKRGTIPVDGTIWTSCTVPGVVALTFDDGPFSFTQSIVDQLTAAGHKATFFQNGLNYGSIYDYASVLQSMIAGGHQIGSHTWSHKDLATLTAAQITDEMSQLEAAHVSIIGKAPTYMRPPYLSTNALAIDTLKTLGYKIISVDIDTQDWAEGPIGEIQLSIDWYKGNQTAGGTISLNHDPYQPTADTFIPAIITYLAEKGLKSVTVGECLGDDAANWYKGGATVPSSSVPAGPSSSVPAGPSSSVPGGTSPSPSVPAGNGTNPGGPGYPSGPGKPPGSYPTGYPTGHPQGPKYTGKPCGGGDTEPGHGENAGRGALPGHKGEGNHGYVPSNSSSSGSSSTNTSAVQPQPSYYTNAASSLAGSAAFVFGVAALALFL